MSQSKPTLPDAEIEQIALSGTVFTGQGQGASFSQLAWVRAQAIAKLGLDPWPGTLNVRLSDPATRNSWAGLRSGPAQRLIPPTPAWGEARCYPVRIAGRWPGAIVYPEVPGYPEDQLELLAAFSLRDSLALADGDTLSLTLNRPIRAQGIIFDVDGTLVDSLPAFYAVARQVLAGYDIAVSLETVRHALNVNHPNFWELAIPAVYPRRDEVIAAVRQNAADDYPEILRQRGRLIPQLEVILSQLQNSGFRLAIMTGSRGFALAPLRTAGLLDFFEIIVTRQDVTERKPNPEGLQKVATGLGLSPAALVYVGDALVDVQASQAAGMAAISVLSGAGDCVSLSQAGPHWVIPDISHLPQVVCQ
jgi:HAD superfamily hydrolase (TIGR01509 family)